ncbi:phage tail tube protein [Bacteroides sp.]|uniref:phage tail tube protein n=1 Tax=Bacteroides sp. TaxID=29523 RepID=UPI002FCAFABC
MSKAKIVLGKDLMMFVDGKALALATSCKLSLSAETIDTQSKDSGIWTEKDIKKLSWNGSSENLFSADESISGYDKLFDAMLARKPIPIKFGIPANADAEELPEAGWTVPTGKHYSGNVIITSLELNAPDGDKATFSASFEGTGALKSIAAAG